MPTPAAVPHTLALAHHAHVARACSIAALHGMAGGSRIRSATGDGEFARWSGVPPPAFSHRRLVDQDSKRQSGRREFRFQGEGLGGCIRDSGSAIAVAPYVSPLRSSRRYKPRRVLLCTDSDAVHVRGRRGWIGVCEWCNARTRR